MVDGLALSSELQFHHTSNAFIGTLPREISIGTVGEAYEVLRK